ncbi:MAG: hypothetical protein HZB37_05085, partial [Planctomycetes bacterium]|nr:hypothetical protein [Planctomycetota bacterium]
MKKNVNCPSCGSLKIQEVGPVPATNIFAGQVLPDLLPGGTLFYCENCGLRFKSPYVRPNEQGILYSQASLDHWGSSPAARADWSLAKEWIQAEFSQAAILDIGCFDGSFFSILSHPYTFFGIEINPQAAKRAAQTGIKILGSDF